MKARRKKSTKKWKISQNREKHKFWEPENQYLRNTTCEHVRILKDTEERWNEKEMLNFGERSINIQNFRNIIEKLEPEFFML